MRPPQRPAASCSEKTALRNKTNATRGGRRRPGKARHALPALLLLAALSAAAVLPGSLAAPATKLVSSSAPAPSAARANAPSTPAKSAALLAPVPFFQAAPGPLTLQTFAADCTTPKSDWNLGETVCAKVSGVTSASIVQLVNPSGYAVIRTDVGLGASSVSFIIPSDETLNVDEDVFDNRGTWRVALVSAIDLGTRLSVPITVHDPDDTVANLQVVKTLADTQATAGANIRALVRVYNAGPDAAANVEFTDTPPANTTFQSLQQTGGPTFACTTPAVDTTGPSVCTIASLARDAAADFVVTYKVNGNVPNATDLSTTATAETTTTETASADNGSGDSATSDNPTPPDCTLACPSNITVDSDPGLAGAHVNYPDATASSGCGTLTTSHPEDEQTGTAFFPIGSTTVTITGAGGSSCSFVVTVIDKRALSITLNGSAEMTVDCGASFTDPGASATDGTNSVPVTTTVSVPNGQVDGNGDPIYVSVPAVNTSAPGDYTITYTATKDAATVTATRIVHVVASTPPVITLANTAGFTPQTVQITDTDDNGNPIVVTETILVKTIECHSSFTPPTATAVSGCGSASVPVTTTGAVDANTPGTYEIIYSAVDNAGNDAETRVRVTVEDTTAPVITLNGDSPLTVECHTAFTDPGASAADDCEGPLPVNASGSVNPDVPGTYTITYAATDSGGRTTTATRTVNVVDTTAPLITLNGSASVTVECHTSYTDAGASVADACDATTPLTSTSNVNVDVPGTYQVSYSATDDAGNTGTATRTVVVSDTIAPTVTLNGPASVTIILGSSFSDPGATASDSCDASVPVTVSGAVNTNAVGTYTLTYSATDDSNNTGTATRTVTVIFNFTGFFSPVNNLPTINQMNAGRSIPVKFSLGGNQGLGIMAAGSPYSQQVSCSTSAPIADVESTETSGGSTLTYDSGSGQYNYNWKTESSWAGTCRVLTVKLIDGTEHTAYFKFK